MMELKLNTLYVLTQGAYLHHDHQTVKVEVEQETRLTVPLHHIESIAVFGRVTVSPLMLKMCCDAGIPISFLSESGRLLGRVDAPGSGNVLLRREQYRRADRPQACFEISRAIVAGKIQNARNLLVRGAREVDRAEDAEALRHAARSLAATLALLERSTSLEEVRGHEGDSARTYFASLSAMVRQQRDVFYMTGRSRRPPLDPMNALLSFIYALLLHDCVSALTVAGLDPSVGFLHTDRPGRPSLGLDLMEEFRPLLTDRLALALINRRQVTEKGFKVRDGGAVWMDDATRRTVITAYQERKQDEVTHPLLRQKSRVGLVPFLQARILARHIRGDIPYYTPCVLKS
jgi:CRISPR-associated protein Cas1